EEANSDIVTNLWSNSSSFLKMLRTAVDLIKNKILYRVSDLHDDNVSDLAFMKKSRRSRHQKGQKLTMLVEKTSDNWKDTNAGAIDAEEISDSDDTDAEPNDTEIENLNQEVNNLNDTEVSIRNTLLDVLNQRKSKDLESEKTFMNSTFLNGIIDLTDADTKRQIKSTLHEEQQSWLDQVLRKQAWKPTPEFKEIEILTPDTSKRKIDGVMRALLTKQTHQILALFEFSFGRKAPMSKDYEDRVKLSRNAMRTLNKIAQKNALWTDVHTIHGSTSPINILYLYEEFACIRYPKNFSQMERFARDITALMNFQSDVLNTVKENNCFIDTIENSYIRTVSVQETPKKKNKGKKETGSPPSSYPGSP
ncbi:12890_t:CDS:2, partial [Acaulospora colombiana]